MGGSSLGSLAQRELVEMHGGVEVGTADGGLLVNFCLLIELIQVQLVEITCVEVEFLFFENSPLLPASADETDVVEDLVSLLAANLDVVLPKQLDLLCQIPECSTPKLL
jgi:hypothetical protein